MAKSEVQEVKSTNQVRAVREWQLVNEYDMHEARIVLINDNYQNDQFWYIVAIANRFEDALAFVERQFGLTVEQQKRELSHIDLWGENQKYGVNYIAEDAPGWSVAYAMWALHDLQYNIEDMMDTFLAP